jgi:hypothetical protein
MEGFENEEPRISAPVCCRSSLPYAFQYGKDGATSHVKVPGP